MSCDACAAAASANVACGLIVPHPVRVCGEPLPLGAVMASLAVFCVPAIAFVAAVAIPMGDTDTHRCSYKQVWATSCHSHTPHDLKTELEWWTGVKGHFFREHCAPEE